MHSVHSTERTDARVDRAHVERMLALIGKIEWQEEGRVAGLIETPEPHRHATRKEVMAVVGRGFAGDHPQKSFYRGVYIPGREVSAISAEILHILGVDPVIVGDNLITAEIDLGGLHAGDLLSVGDIVLERSSRPARPCITFRNRTSPEAFAVVSRKGYRGALFNVREGGMIRVGDPIRVIPGRSDRNEW